MLTISKAIKAGQGEYYLSLAGVDDYYTAGNEPPGYWLGRGAAALRLDGELNQEHFRNLLRGLAPEGDRKLVRNADHERRAGWDFTWSAPKSVSVAWSQADPATRERIEECLRRAAAAGVAYLEAVAGISRRGEDGHSHEAARLVLAAFLHSTSRAQDPQLHLHTILLNVGVRADGTTGTLEPKGLYRHQMAAGALFRAELAARLETELGLRARRENRAFELLGVDPELIAFFSKRRAAIEAELARRGQSGGRAAERANFATRAVKVARPRAELFAEWQRIGHEHHWSAKELSWMIDAAFPARRVEWERAAAGTEALAQLTAMAADITSPAAALQAATLLVPKAQQDANPFFSNAARHLMSAALLSLILQAPGRWTLRHLLLVLRSESLLRLVLAQTEFTRPLLQYGEHPATFQNILSSLLTRIAPFEIIAAAWDRAEHKLSLRAWLEQEAILILANDEDNRAAIDTINQLLFKRLSELVLARDERPEDSQRTTWFFLDEVRQAGRLDGLSALMTKGRSKGAAVLLGFQDINGLHEVYGREAANELVGQCNTKALLRLNSPETARWASQLFGASEFLESRRSHSRSRNFRELGWQQGGSSGESISNAIAKRELVLDSEFLDLPETSFDNGVTGFFLNPLTGAFKHHLPPDWLRQHLRPPDPATPNLIRRPGAHQYLRPWSDQDASDLGLPATRNSPSTAG